MPPHAGHSLIKPDTTAPLVSFRRRFAVMHDDTSHPHGRRKQRGTTTATATAERGETPGGQHRRGGRERLLAMVAERDQALAALEDARLDAQSYESALKARIAELKAQVAGLAPQAGRRRTSVRGGRAPLNRLYDELPLRKDEGYYRDDLDWTSDEELVQEVLESLMRTQPKVRAEDASLVAKLADLLERAGPQFIAAARRHVALTEVKAAARVKAKATAPTGKPTTKTTKRR